MAWVDLYLELLLFVEGQRLHETTSEAVVAMPSEKAPGG